MKRTIISLLTICLVCLAMGQTIGSWQIYPAYTVCTRNIPADGRIYGLMESKLMVYDPADETVSTFDWHRQLNDISIAYIHFSASAHRLILIYDNGNIDLLSTQNDDDVINLAQLKNSTLQNKQVQNVQVSGDMAYVCTGFGLLCIDLAEGIITDTYDLGLSVTSCASTDDALYLGTTTGVWKGDLSLNLKEKSNWQQIHATLMALRMEYFDGRLWAQQNSSIYISDANISSFSLLQKMRATFMNLSDNSIILGNATQTYIYTSATECTDYTGTFAWNDLRKDGSTFWASDGDSGLQAYELDASGAFQLKTSKLQYNSPLHDYSLYFFQHPEGIYVAGGNRNYSTTSRDGTAMLMAADGTWTNFDASSAQQAFPQERFLDVTSIAKDPSDDTHYYIGTARSGIFEFQDQQCTGHIGLENSPLQSILPNSSAPHYYVVADGIQFDDSDNLWVLNPTAGKADTTIRVRLKDGTWTGIPCPEIQEASTTDKIFFDSRGWAWINSRRMSQRGIFLLDYNGTVAYSNDDKRQLRTSITNQDGTNYNPDEFYCITENSSGQLWIGTNLGPFLISDPTRFRQTDFTFEQIKVSRNDGSGLADYLLNGVPILSITIDGGERLWFGSQGSGAYLISSDCQEEIHHFTTANSPLISDNVFDIAIDHSTGCVYFATDKGICSYMSDATQAADELRESDVIAYPNPVSPDYNGPIAIKGLTMGAEVKIVSSSGRLIASGYSNGGTFTWDGRNKQGRRVASGIYHVISSTSDGETAIVSRIAFIH
ncbi:MAG: hypothetical protein K6C30_06935 [Bacteroidaceae bacterium]|nr:hypothetical protein [Bacteroidaceae bacterium]